MSVDGPLPASNESKQNHVRAIGKWAPDSFPLTVTATYLRQVSKQADCGFADQTQDLSRRDTPGPCTVDSQISLPNLVAQYDFGWAALQSTTSRSVKHLLLDEDVNRLFDSTCTGGCGLQSSNSILFMDSTDSRGKSLSEELRLTSPEGGG